MGVYDDLKKMAENLNRRCGEEDSKLIDLYAAGVWEKFRLAEYGLARLRDLDAAIAAQPAAASPPVADATGKPPPGFTDREQVSSYTDSIFTALASTYDIFAQIVAVAWNLSSLTADKVSFKKVAKHIQTKRRGSDLTYLMKRVLQSPEYTQVHAYRHSLIHRRPIYIEIRGVEDKPRQAVRRDTTAPDQRTGPFTVKLRSYITRDPILTDHSRDDLQLLVPKCEKILGWVKDQIAQLADTLRRSHLK